MMSYLPLFEVFTSLYEGLSLLHVFPPSMEYFMLSPAIVPFTVMLCSAPSYFPSYGSTLTSLKSLAHCAVSTLEPSVSAWMTLPASTTEILPSLPVYCHPVNLYPSLVYPRLAAFFTVCEPLLLISSDLRSPLPVPGSYVIVAFAGLLPHCAVSVTLLFMMILSPGWYILPSADDFHPRKYCLSSGPVRSPFVFTLACESPAYFSLSEGAVPLPSPASYVTVNFALLTMYG